MVGRSASDFAHFYVTDLLKRLKRLEAVRKSVLGKVKVLIAVTAGVIGAGLWIGLTYELGWTVALAACVVSMGAASVVYRHLTSSYVHEFKIGVIRKIVDFIDPGLTYRADGFISAPEFNSSRIFTRYPERMRGDDLVEGKVGCTGVRFSEVHAEHRSETTNRHGRRQSRYSTIFRGLFFMADFNKKFCGKTVVLPDTAERFLGSVGSFLQSINICRGEVIRMDNPEFEKHFVVYGDDQIESRYVLSTSLLERILDFRKKTGRPVYLSFVGSTVYVAVRYRRSLFEPRIFSRITGFKTVCEYFNDLNLALGIVEDLNLNTRIWAGAGSVEV